MTPPHPHHRPATTRPTTEPSANSRAGHFPNVDPGADRNAGPNVDMHRSHGEF